MPTPSPVTADPTVLSLLHAGSSAGLSSLGASLALDLDSSVPSESHRATEHLAALRAEFVQAETKQRMLAAIVKGKDERDGEGASLLGVLSALQAGGAQGEAVAVAASNHAAAMRSLQERQTQAAAELAEIQMHTTSQAAAIKADIQKLLQSWSAVETSKTALEATRKESTVQAALAQWAALHSAWGGVESALAAAEALVPLLNASTTPEGREATEKLVCALDAAQKQLDALSISASVPSATPEVPSPSLSPSFDLDKLAETAALLKKQVQTLAEWSSRNEELSAAVQAASRTAPRITSFATAQEEAARALQGATAPPVVPALSGAIKATKLACGVLSKLSGVAVLRRESESINGAPATRLVVLVRGQHVPTGVAPIDDLYASPDAFAWMFAPQEAALGVGVGVAAGNAEPDCLVLSLLVLTASQAAAAGQVAGVGAVAGPAGAGELDGAVLLSGQVVGTVPAATMAQWQQQQQQQQVQSQAPRSDAATAAAALERSVRPCGPGVAHAVSRSVERALESQTMYGQGVRAVEALLRDVAFEVAQAQAQQRAH